MNPETVVAPRADLDIENPWSAPEACTPVRLRRSGDGSEPRLATSVFVWFDAGQLSILFSAADDRVEATHYRHDAPLYEEDVIEIFVAPSTAREYFEIEVNPRGTIFDARVESPDGVRATMHVDRAWDCEGLTAAVRSVTAPDGAMTIDTLVRIPFASLGTTTPAEGETWRINFFRIDRHPEAGDEYSAWRPTLKIPPDFHVTAAFGVLRFSR